MKATVTFDIETEEDANRLAEALPMLMGGKVLALQPLNQPIASPPPAQQAAPAEERQPVSPPPAETAKGVKAPKKAATPAPPAAPAEVETPDEDEEPLELSDIRSKAAEAIKGGFRPQVAAFLKEKGAKDITQLDPSHYGEFMKTLKNLLGE